MFELLLAVTIFSTIFGVDYLFYKRDAASYQYVSRRTYGLFIVGQIILLSVFSTYFEPFFEHIWYEIAAIAVLLVLVMLFSFVLRNEKLLVCHTSSRTERCLTPQYVQVKGAELMFQQLTYAALAFTLADLLGTAIYSYIAYVLILLIIHTPVILSMNKAACNRLTFGILIISGPIFYTFTELELFSPAIYLHSLLYVFLWLTFADWEGKNAAASSVPSNHNRG